MSLPILRERALCAKPSAGRLLSPQVAYVRYRSEIERLRRGVDSLTAMTFSPAWWEAIPGPRGYRHRMLVLEREGAVVAALRFRERTLWGVPVGILHGIDGKGESLVLCQPGTEDHWLVEGARALFASRPCVALLLRHAIGDAGERSLQTSDWQRAGLKVWRQPATSQWQTAVGETMDETLEPFGHRTRRNLRHALRRIAQNGWEFLPELTPEEVSGATVALAARSTHRYTAKAGEARLELEREQPRSFSMGLRDQSGSWLSVLSGVRRADGVTDVFWQSNVAWGRDSVGFIMRAALLQHEGSRGTRRLRWIGGTSPMMEHCCLPEAGHEMLIARPGLRFTLLRRLLHTRLATDANPMKRLLRLKASGSY